MNTQSLAAKRQRLDSVLVSRGLATNREQAHRFILSGSVKVDGVLVDKRAKLVNVASQITLDVPETNYVSRGGSKLVSAIEAFDISCQGIVGMDVGASTGGFTDCLLQHGAARVYAIDVGYGQLDWKLRNDSRVVVHERCNIRYLEREAIPDRIQLAVIDVSFISLKLVVPCAVKFLEENGWILALLKPQFEVGKGMVGRGGVVRSEAQRMFVKNHLLGYFQDMGLEVIGTVDSPVSGRKGNKEIFVCLRKR